MNQLEDQIRELEMKVWKAAEHRDAAAFLQVVEEDAVMVCGGYRCTGKDYAQVISEFDLASYEISRYETVLHTEDVVQILYEISTKVTEERNKDLEGRFQVTSTWKRNGQDWKLIYNMDSRIMGPEM